MNEIADLRHSSSRVPNTPATALAAVEAGFSEIALYCVYALAAAPHSADLFCVPPYHPEYLLLSKMDWVEWYREFTAKRSFPRPVSVREFLGIKGVERVWLFVDSEVDQAGAVCEAVAVTGGPRHVLVFSGAKAPQVENCADASGAAEFVYCATAAKTAAALLTTKPGRILTYHGVNQQTHRLIPF